MKQFWICGRLAYAKQRWGMYDELVEMTGFDKVTLRRDKAVAESIESVRRRTDLSHSHHREVISLEPNLQDELLSKAEN